MRYIAAAAALALAGVPAGALAAKPSHPVTPANTNANSNANGTTTVTTTSTTPNHNPKVMFIIRGKVTNYSAGSSVALTVTSSNRDRSALPASSAFTAKLDANTKIVLHNGAAVANGDMVLVQIRAAKTSQPSDLASTPAKQAIDQGASH
jgi:hypothetical protein